MGVDVMLQILIAFFGGVTAGGALAFRRMWKTNHRLEKGILDRQRHLELEVEEHRKLRDKFRAIQAGVPQAVTITDLDDDEVEELREKVDQALSNPEPIIQLITGGTPEEHFSGVRANPEPAPEEEDPWNGPLFEDANS